MGRLSVASLQRPHARADVCHAARRLLAVVQELADNFQTPMNDLREFLEDAAAVVGMGIAFLIVVICIGKLIERIYS